MCGNGVRVFAHYLRASELERRDEFVVGIAGGTAPGAGAQLSTTRSPTSPSRWARPTSSAPAKRSWAAARFTGLAVDVGNPHLACVDPDLTRMQLAALDVAAPVSFDRSQFPDGVNVEVLTAPSAVRCRCGCTNEVSAKPVRAEPEPSPPPSQPWLIGGAATGSLTVRHSGRRGRRHRHRLPPATCAARRFLSPSGEISEEWWRVQQR